MKKRLNKNSNYPNDISRTTVLLLVFLAVIISILGTWTVLVTVDNIASNTQTSKLAYEESINKPTGYLTDNLLENPGDKNNG